MNFNFITVIIIVTIITPAKKINSSIILQNFKN